MSQSQQMMYVFTHTVCILIPYTLYPGWCLLCLLITAPSFLIYKFIYF